MVKEEALNVTTSSLSERDPFAGSYVPKEYQGTPTDRQDMHALGRKQVLRRRFKFLTMLGFASTVMVAWEFVLVVSPFGLADGGKPAVFWGLLLSPVVLTPVYASLAEMASMRPTAAGQYAWVSELAPPKFRKDRLPLVETVMLVLHVLGVFAICIPLWILAPKSSASETIVNFTSNGGWQDLRLASTIGVVPMIGMLIGYDCCVHMPEEVQDASRTIPAVVIWAVVSNAAMLLLVGITYIFCLGDLNSALNSATGQPVIQVFYDATGSYTAFNAFNSLGTVSILSSYTITVDCLIWRRLFGKALPPRRWSLGRWGLAFNLFSLCLTTPMQFFYVWPLYYPVTARNMNWSSAMLGGVTIVALVYYLVNWRHDYGGPVSFVISEG
ncbi:hypothetical protein KC315_g3197 [Hortaea werneckii]|nr:hypothetical protein KC315_g3197 [Hortaea werneckii]KAI7347773.1 hypothetical protein KC354_g13843 [Hortaea werneckii]